jgi:DNA-binding beta-propeller fold protein YncE
VDSAGNVYVADEYNYTIRRITPDRVVTTLAGLVDNWGCADGTGSSARFNRPSGVAVDSVGNVYVADTWNDTIRLGFTLQPKLILSLPQSLSTQGLRLTLLCAPGSNYRIDASSDLVSWAPLTNLLSTNRTIYFQDPDATNYTQRFYRAAAQ